MSAWMIWMIIAVALVVAEMFTLTFYLLWLGIGAGIAALFAWLLPGEYWLQFVSAGVVAVVLTLLTKRLTRRMQGAKGFKDAVDDLLGKKGEVVEKVEPGSLGIVRIGTEVWSASSEEVLVPGERIVVVKRGNAVLQVSKWKGE